MYTISDQQIDFILNDLHERGITLESLRQNLLDHICILIEEKLEEDGDFRLFYATVIKDFYKQELRELEEETLFLLTHKNNHPMKKAMMLSGAFSVAAFVTGSFFKILHSRLTDFPLFLGFTSFVFLFLPLIFLVKIKETTAKQDKLILASGTIATLFYFFCMLLKFVGPNWTNALGIHWTHWDQIWLTIWLLAFIIALFVFVPAYFFAGISKPETKTNTILITVLLIVFIGMQFTFTSLQPFREDKHPVALENRPESGQTSRMVSDTAKSIAENRSLSKRIN
ncbi:MAG TPA: hypothetical protein VNS58_03920 [Puia sp.]|nr:hypothetical protein [Puia sp.]